MYVWLIHTVVRQNPAQYCKAIILQLNINLNIFAYPTRVVTVLIDVKAIPASFPPASRVWTNSQRAASQARLLMLRSEPSSGSPLCICPRGPDRQQVSHLSLDPSVRISFQKSCSQQSSSRAQGGQRPPDQGEVHTRGRWGPSEAQARVTQPPRHLERGRHGHPAA